MSQIQSLMCVVTLFSDDLHFIKLNTDLISASLIPLICSTRLLLVLLALSSLHLPHPSCGTRVVLHVAFPPDDYPSLDHLHDPYHSHDPCYHDYDCCDGCNCSYGGDILY